jgi:cell division protein FtsB
VSRSQKAKSSSGKTAKKKTAKKAAGEGRARLTRIGGQGQRIPVALAALVALVILGTSFPFSGLLSQHRQLSSTAAQLRSVQDENRLLAEQQQQLDTQTDIDRLARQYYQMVLPGQTLFDVLPPSGLASARSGGSTPGDPGSQPLVDPSKAPDMTPDPGLAPSTPTSGSASPTGAATGGSSTPRAETSRSSGAPSGSAPSSFWSRVANSLEFWK